MNSKLLFKSGIVRFSRAGGTLDFPYPESDLLDVLAVVSGLKPVSYINIIEPGRQYLDLCRSAAKFFGLEFSYVQRATPREAGQIYFAREKALIREAARLRALTDPDTPAMHALLGYPACCAGAFVKSKASRRKADIVPLIRKNTPGPGPYSFVVNDLFNPANRDRLPRSPVKVHLLSWHPCRYDCPESLAAGRAFWQFVNSIAPGLAGMLKASLENIVLYLDGDCVVLDGRLKNPGRCSYSSAPFSTLPAGGASLAKLRAGNELVIEEGRLRLLKNGRAAGSIPCDTGLLLDFGADREYLKG